MKTYFGFEYYRGAFGYWNAKVNGRLLTADTVHGIKCLIKKYK